jgi:hypothetical protein
MQNDELKPSGVGFTSFNRKFNLKTKEQFTFGLQIDMYASLPVSRGDYT